MAARPELRIAGTAIGWAGSFGLLVGSARSGGGYFPTEYLTMGIAALILGVVLVLLARELPRPTRRGVVALGGLLAYAAWVGVSGSWSAAPADAAAAFQRTVAYAAVLAFAMLAVGAGRGARGLVAVVWVALAGVAVAGALSRLLPGLELAPLQDAFRQYRLSWPLSYWNAQGAAASMAVVLALGIAGDRGSSRPVRAVAAATVPLLAVALLLTVSRGSVVALLVGLVAFVALSRRPVQAVAVTVACALPAAGALLLAGAQPAIVDDPAAVPVLSTVGPRILLAAVLLGVVAAGLAVVAVAVTARLEQAGRRFRRPPRAAGWLPAVGLGAVVLVLAALLVAADRIDSTVAQGTTGVRSFVEEQRQTFLDPNTVPRAGIARLGSVGGSRSDLFRVALDDVGDAPLVGAGAGSFPLRWLRDRRTPQPVRNVHSLPLEVLAETGIIGFLLLGAAFAAIGRGALLARRHPRVLPRSFAAGVSGAILAFLASCAVDWTWQMGTLTAAVLLLAATLLADGGRAEGPATAGAGGRSRATGEPPADDGRRPGPARSRSPLAVGAVVLVLLVGAALLVGPLRDERRLRSAGDAVERDPARALRDAAQAVGPATTGRVAAVSVSAFARAGRLDLAERLARADVRAHPEDTYAVRRLYEVQRLRGRRVAAARTRELLRRLDPRYVAGTGF